MTRILSLLLILLIVCTLLSACGSPEQSKEPSAKSQDDSATSTATTTTTENSTTAAETTTTTTENSTTTAETTTTTIGTEAPTSTTTMTATTATSTTTTLPIINGNPTDGNFYYFNPAERCVEVGKGLTDPVFVTESAFYDIYAIQLTDILAKDVYTIKYVLEYALDTETIQPDLSKLEYGWVSVRKENSVVIVLTVSPDTYVSSRVPSANEIVTSHINNTQVILYDVGGFWGPFLQAKMRVGDWYITCTMKDSTQEEMVTFLDDLIECCFTH